MSAPFPADYDSDPDRFRTNQESTRRFNARGDLHAPVAARLAGLRPVLDLGGGNGLLARHLGGPAIVLDRAAYVADAPRPAVRAEALALPFRDDSFAAVAALWMLYHLTDVRAALREARRVLRPDGVFVACTSSRYNDPELRDVLPGWGAPTPFDAEEAAGLVGEVFEVTDTESWDQPWVTLPDQEAVAMFLRGRGAPPATLPVPLTVTKRGILVWARAAG